MCHTDIGNQRAVRARNRRKMADFTKMVHTHFQHGNLVLAIEPKHRQRQSNVVVIIALCL